MSIHDQLKQLLLNQVPKFGAPTKPGWAPAKPQPVYRHRLLVSRTEMITVYVNAVDEDEASDAVTFGTVDPDLSTASKDDCYVDEVEQLDECVNEELLEEWDTLYSARYSEDGIPMCSTCGNGYDDASELTVDPEFPEEWCCTHCLPGDEDE